MAGPDQVVGPGPVVYSSQDGPRPVVCGNPCSHPFPCFDGDGKGCAKGRSVLPCHGRQPELHHALRGEGETDEAPGVVGHEVYGLRRRLLCGDHDVTLVLTALVVDHDDHLPIPHVFDYVVDACYRHGCLLFIIGATIGEIKTDSRSRGGDDSWIFTSSARG